MKNDRLLTKLQLHAGLDAWSQMDCLVVKFERDGCCLFFSCNSLYSLLHLDLYNGKAYIWVNHTWPRWTKMLETMHCLPSNLLGSKPTRQTNSRFLVGNADFRSMSTIALFGALACWAFDDRSRGGFENPASTQQAQTLFEKFLKCLRGEQFLLRFMNYRHEMDWPHLEQSPVGGKTLVLVVNENSHVEFTDLRQRAELEPASFAAQFYTAYADLATPSLEIPLLTFVKAVWERTHPLDPIRRALIRDLAFEFEAIVKSPPRLLKHKEFVTFDGEPTFNSDTGRDEQLWCYRESAKRSFMEAFSHVPMVSSTFDDSNVRGLILQNTAVIHPTNLACWGPTQVSVYIM